MPIPPVRPVEPVAPALPWQGGKRHLAACLVERIAAIPHDLYAEPFIGMGGVFLRRRLRPRVEAINDLSRDVAGFFRVLQRHPEALYGELAFALASRAEFERLQRVDPSTMTDLERAARFYVLQKLAYAGKVSGRTFGVSGEARFDIRRQRRLLEAVHRRLAAVIIECLPWQDFVARYDRPGALFYLDPPYWGGEEDYGKNMFGRPDFERMAEQLRALRGRFLLSINDASEIRAIFAGLAIEEVTTTYTIGDADRGAPRAELIIGDGRGGEVGQMRLW